MIWFESLSLTLICCKTNLIFVVKAFNSFKKAHVWLQIKGSNKAKKLKNKIN